MTHADKSVRRKAIADAVQSGRALQQVALDFGITVHWARRACLDHGVSPAIRTSIVRTFVILKRLIDGEPQVKIAADLGITRQRVNEISKAAKEAGITFNGT